MKICPRCNKTYTDENLNFCLDDGSVLNQAAPGGDMPETVMMNQPRPTQPPANPFTTAQAAPPPPQLEQPSQTTWNTGGQPAGGAPPPKKSSKTWIWVVLILGLGILLCGGGAIGVAILSSMNQNSNSTVDSKTPTPSKSGSPSKSASPSNSSTTTTTSPSSDRDDVEKAELSEWVRQVQVYGTTEMSGDELLMASKQKNYYYAICAPEDTFKTEQADIVLTVRNVDDAPSRFGYGLVFHSNPMPLQQGYAFLINSKTKKYRVVHHSPQKEDAVIAWTKSDAIKDGSQDNKLEVRDLADKIELYINGTLVNTIKNVYGYSGGVVGLYSGDAVKAGFKDLEVRK